MEIFMEIDNQIQNIRNYILKLKKKIGLIT